MGKILPVPLKNCCNCQNTIKLDKNIVEFDNKEVIFSLNQASSEVPEDNKGSNENYINSSNNVKRFKEKRNYSNQPKLNDFNKVLKKKYDEILSGQSDGDQSYITST